MKPDTNPAAGERRLPATGGSRRRQIGVYLFTLVFSILYIVVGRQIALQGQTELGLDESAACQAVVTQIIAQVAGEPAIRLTFLAEITSGQHNGETVQVMQSVSSSVYPVQELVEVGDRVLIYENERAINTPWSMLEYIRSDKILLLGAAFALAVLIFGRMKGVNTLISLAFTCLSVFIVFIPAVLSGQNIYGWAIVTCLYIIVMTMLFINGACKKSFVAGFGCFAGVVMAGVISAVMDQAMKLTGMTSEDTLYLTMLELANPIDLRGVVFAAIIIGAVGAIMDVAMDIASSLNELRLSVPGISARQLLRSGFNIGRDVMGTMANTLVLAYIGSSLSTTLLFAAYDISSVELFNMELIIVELLQALAGSIGILLSIPLTSLTCALVYPKQAARVAATGDNNSGESVFPS